MNLSTFNNNTQHHDQQLSPSPDYFPDKQDSSVNVSSCSMDSTRYLLLTGYVIVLIIGTVGNALVLIVFRHFWRKGSLLELLILYLAVFDLLSSILSPILFSYWIFTCDKWYLGYAACKIFPTLSRILPNLSMTFLMIMALDRYVAIVWPFKERLSRQSVHIVVVVSLCLCTVWEVQYIVDLRIRGDQCYTYRLDKNDDVPDIALLMFRDIVFIFVMLFSTISAYSVLHSGHERQRNHCRANAEERITYKKNIIILILMGFVSFITILPRDFLHLAFKLSRFTSKSLNHNQEILTINSYLKLLQTTNCINNVFIYAGKHDHFGEDILNIFCSKKLWKINSTPHVNNGSNFLIHHERASSMYEVSTNGIHCIAQAKDDIPLLNIRSHKQNISMT